MMIDHFRQPRCCIFVLMIYSCFHITLPFGVAKFVGNFIHEKEQQIKQNLEELNTKDLYLEANSTYNIQELSSSGFR